MPITILHMYVLYIQIYIWESLMWKGHCCYLYNIILKYPSLRAWCNLDKPNYPDEISTRAAEGSYEVHRSAMVFHMIGYNVETIFGIRDQHDT